MDKKYEVHAWDGEEWIFLTYEESLEESLHGAMTARDNKANGYTEYRVVININSKCVSIPECSKGNNPINFK